ncbi:hypothetical protein [Oceanobacillus manasiensis]|uniref:hypothetical protein n=1 Tax=Oceanobacillus manasiensis TaxID=586413 RepID=UPI0005AA085A|nr:hypothetical protein [Oceanobacillus manasiensis]
MKNVLIFIVGLLMGVLLLPMILEWLGLPSGGELLERVLGEPNAVTIPIVIVSMILLFYLIIRGLFKQAKKEK